MEGAPGAHFSAGVNLEEARARPIAGRWRPANDGRTGWVEPFPGSEVLPGHQLLFELIGPAPAPWTPVAILPGGEVLPWPRGPERPASSRAQDFLALSVVRPDELVRLAPAPEPALGAWWEGLREALARLRFALGERIRGLERRTSAGLLCALLTGDRSRLSPERIDLFARTGTSHLLAISGWHVVLFAALVLLPVSRRLARIAGLGGSSERSLALLVSRIVLLALFTVVAGGGEPVLRATLALVLALIGRTLPAARALTSLGRRPDGISLLAAAFSFECLADPCGLRSLSLTLSYAATLGLMLGTGPLLALAVPAGDPWSSLAISTPARLRRLVITRAQRTFGSGLAASVAAVLATLPISWRTFGEFSLAGPLLTCLALPPFTGLCLIAWIGALVPADALAAPAELCARALYGILELGDALPGTPLPLPPRPALLLWAAVALAFLALREPRARAPACFLWAGLLLPWSAAPSGLELELLDVGHGTAAVLRAPGLEALVFDAGSRDRRGIYPEALAPLLARWEVGRPIAVLSHPDQDHSSALGRLSERYSLAAFLGARPAQPFVRLPHGAPVLDLLQGSLTMPSPCPELGLTLLRGSLPAACEGGNEGSRSLEVTWGGQRLLLCGDAEGPGILGAGPGPIRLLLFPHHGSESPYLGPLLEELEPAEIWVSSSQLPPVSRELDRRHLAWRWTGQDGPLALRLP